MQYFENGVQPIWVFDGKAPELKAHELEKRKEMKIYAKEQREMAEAAGDWARAKQMASRTIRVTPEMTVDAVTLVRLMGAGVVEAPCEAEA